VPLGRVHALLGDLVGGQVGRGTLVAWVQQAAAVLAPVEEQIKAALRQAPVLRSDETGVRRGGQLARAHVASTSRLTHYAIHSKRGNDATEAIGILPGFGGVSVHDGWASYQTYTACRHALCNVHHLRELTFLEEEEHQAWAKDLKELLLAMRAAADHARAQSWPAVPEVQRTAFHWQYRALLTHARAAHPPPNLPRRPGQRGRQAQSPTRNLLERLTLYEEQVLAFLDDLTVPFDNNQAERDLRSFKVQQKISGCFRSDPGAVAYARIRGYLATLRKQGRALLAALQTVFAGQPLAPEFA
jgi:transposase